MVHHGDTSNIFLRKKGFLRKSGKWGLKSERSQKCQNQAAIMVPLSPCANGVLKRAHLLKAQSPAPLLQSVVMENNKCMGKSKINK